MTEPILTTCNLSIGYASPRHSPRVVAEDITTSLCAGELVCLIGPNGAGKSTLMRTLVGLQPPLQGHVLLDGVDIHNLKPKDLARAISIVLTDRISVGILSVYALVALGRHPHTDWTGRLRPEDETAVRGAIEAVGAGRLAHRNVSDLSDGERQRVMIARALAQEPRLMVLDEPTAFLDLPRRVETMRLLKHLARSTMRAILLSTHDLDLALRCADLVWLLPPGGPLRVGSPEDLVLTGAFEAAFRGDGVAFDASTGGFRIEDAGDNPVGLVGEGLPAFWTIRALERERFQVVAQGGDLLNPRIEVVSENGGTFWRSTVGRVVCEHRSLYEVISTLRRVRGDRFITMGQASRKGI